MVENKNAKRERDIKSKLMAAIAMLLVSSIMMVSTSYAWFTLSTAPEVTGITTAVGANGNLEMALLPYEAGEGTNYETVADALAGITSGTGDSMDVQGKTDANVTWGNLVDLSDPSYALSKISLYPSKLNAETDDEGNVTLADTYLSTPKYGSDGRVINTDGVAMARKYGQGAFDVDKAYGVRAVGVASGMSGQEQAYRSALAAANAAATKANNASKTAMAGGGSALATIGMKKVTGDAYTQADIQGLQTALSALIADDTGALFFAEESLFQYIQAGAVATAGEAGYATVLATFDSAKTNGGLSALPASVTAAYTAEITAVSTLRAEIEDAVADLDDVIAAGDYTWEAIDEYVLMLGDINTMELCGKPMTYWMERNDDNSFAHMNELMGNMSNIILVLKPGQDGGKGTFMKLADIVGYYEAEVTFTDLQYGSFDLSGLTARMQVNPSINPTHLVKAKQTASSNTSFGDGGSAISDFYGYIIDLAFRTNAADSWLQLQTDSIDRIYADSDVNINTMGGGSTMSFSMAGLENFNVTQVANLMSYIRIVFFDPDTLTVLGEARLDFNQVTNQDGVALAQTADGKYEQTIEIKDDSGAVTGTKTGYKGLDANNNEIEIDVTSISMAMRMWDPTGNDNKGTWASDSKIVSLIQNTATAVSALVYMDGEEITNKDASTAGITGTMNIQFSSSATLTPMEYGELRQPAKENTTKEYKVKINGVDAGVTVKDGQKLEFTIPTEYADWTITSIKMGETDVISSLVDGKLTIDEVTGDIEITATAPTQGG